MSEHKRTVQRLVSAMLDDSITDEQMAELDDQDWKDMQSYMNAHLDQAKAFYRPNSRGRFCEQFSDVFAHMVRWRGKNGKAKKPTTKGDTIWK